jgi:hypothetical protein
MIRTPIDGNQGIRHFTAGDMIGMRCLEESHKHYPTGNNFLHATAIIGCQKLQETISEIWVS